jgi:hypothetical protein
MKYIIRIFFSIIAMLFLFIVNGQDRYTVKQGDPNGINKWYMGRQIAHVMSHYGIDWLERPERQYEENTALLLKNLDLKPGMNFADIGAGVRGNNDNVYINYDVIWLFLQKGFDLNYIETQELTKIWLGEAYNLRGVITYASPPSFTVVV